MVIRSIDHPLAEGDPILLLPEGLLKRWPRGEPLPQIGDKFEGRIVHVSRQEHRDAIASLLRGNILERCDAVDRLPLRVASVFYSPSQARNLRRVARNLCPSLREHAVALLARGIKVSSKVLIKVAARRTEPEQWAEWRASLQ
jgi:hypothetical protein